MSCLGNCLEFGPPPDSIIFIPPPPVPSFLHVPLQDVALNATPCSLLPICEPWAHVQSGGKFSESPRKDIETWAASTMDDTWLLILVTSSIVVLLLGTLLAMFLLKCRDADCNANGREVHQTKSPERREHSAFNGTVVSQKHVHPADAVLYNGSPTLQDNRLVWAALTPRGTQHFISENYPKNILNYVDNDVHYEAVDNLNIHPLERQQSPSYDDYQKDYDYEDPTPLIESYQLSNIETETECPYFAPYDNLDISYGTLRKHQGISITTPYRPKVSSPTRIEHPNLPPLNLFPPSTGSTLKRNGRIPYFKNNHTNNDSLHRFNNGN